MNMPNLYACPLCGKKIFATNISLLPCVCPQCKQTVFQYNKETFFDQELFIRDYFFPKDDLFSKCYRADFISECYPMKKEFTNQQAELLHKIVSKELDIAYEKVKQKAEIAIKNKAYMYAWQEAETNFEKLLELRNEIENTYGPFRK